MHKLAFMLRCGFLLVVAMSARAVVIRARASVWIFDHQNPIWQRDSSIRSEEDLTRGIWQNHPFTPITRGPELENVVRQMVNRSAKFADGKKTDAIVRLVSGFLAAYSTDDFEAFWKFRVPNDRYSSNQRSRKIVTAYMASVRKNYGLADDPTLSTERPEDIKQLVAAAWRLARVIETNREITERTHFHDVCTACMKAVATDSMPIRELSAIQIEPDLLMEAIKRAPNWGVAVSPSFVDARPAGKTGFDQFVDVEVIVKLSSGLAQPMRLIAGWDADSACYVPVKLAMPRAVFSRPQLLF